jgi:2-polyprenyl-3-methyl-5-hydroxy-6-metoxy-1,4-benzoquinol methylase
MPDPETLLWKNISELPYFRGLLRAVEGCFYQDIPLEEPILDLGCGDGHFVTVTFDRQINIGLDPWFPPLQKAEKTKAYRSCINAVGCEMPFENEYFSTLISNSVLEHIEDVDAVLEDSWRVLKPRGRLIICVPNDSFTSNLSLARFFEGIHLQRLARTYRNFFNRISRHKHCDSPEEWVNRLRSHGFQVKKWWKYFSPRALAVLEWGHYFGLPSLICNFLFKRWILVPAKWNLFIALGIVSKSFHEDPVEPQGAYTFFIAEKGQKP